MNLSIKEITAKNDWEDFVMGLTPHTFLQSWNWGEFNKSLGHKIWRLGIYEIFSLRETSLRETNLAGVALVIKIVAKRGTFLFVPYGPIVENPKSEIPNPKQIKNPKFQILKTLTTYLRELAKKEKCSFIRVSPILLKTAENEKLFKDSGFRKSPIYVHAELMWILDVTPSEDELLRNMRKTTRYLVKKAEKDGVKIIKHANPEGADIFNALYEETAERQHFTAYSGDYLKKEFMAFKEDNQILFFFAIYNGEPISGAMIVFYGNAAFYHQGASSLKYSKVPAPYLLQWEIIREAKRRGLKFYNFWGIAPEPRNVSRWTLRGGHPWAGLSLFKKGFGGFEEEYLPAQDLVLKSSYWITYLIEKMRKIKRNL